MGVSRYVTLELLLRALNAHVIREAGKVRINLFWVPTEEELAGETRRSEQGMWGRRELTDYGEEHRQFRDLCMLARRQ
jgi:hypothetical protein